jgi:2-amino-4-hydroxy-6-hydroxymethyldihydropteridine diphosphokinase
MGANLPSCAGSPEATLTAAASRLNSLGRVTRRSSLYSTEPVGFADQPRFVNAVVELETALSPRELLIGLMALEQEFGRDRSGGVQNGPRTLDLDILLFGDLEISEPDLEIPHPRLKERAFVLVPLREIAPRILDAEEVKTVSQSPHVLGGKCESGANAVVRIQWSDWRAGSDDAGPAAS